MTRRRITLEVTLPWYEPPPGKCVVPVGLESLLVHPSEVGAMRATLLIAGDAVGFVCHSEGLTVVELTAGGKSIVFSSAGFPGEAAADGIIFPAVRGLLQCDEVVAMMRNDTGAPLQVRANFLIEVGR